MRTEKIFPTLIACLLLVTMGCSRDKAIYHIEVDRAIPVSITRFDSVVKEYVQLADTVQQQAVADDFGPFWDVYARSILSLYDAPYYTEGLQRFLSDEAIARLYNDVATQFPNLEQEEEDLSWLVARYKVLFPHKPTPIFQSHLSGLGHSIVTLDSLISISLDCYLGDDYVLYPSRYNRYELPLHNRSRILPDVGEVLLRNALAPQQGNTLLDAMIYEGKVLFLLSALLDNEDASLLLGYSPEQVAWCNNQQANIWTAIVEQNHLYTSDNITVRKYIQPAPFTATLTPDAPGRVGRWVGWRIYRLYVEKCGLSPTELVNDSRSAQEILSVSGYNGK